jgi:alkylation response protein AidB-like acyl-CoA dehydrogenase
MSYDLALANEDQAEIRRLSRRFLEQEAPLAASRPTVASFIRGSTSADRSPSIPDSLGWLSLPLSEARGGAGLGLAEQCVVSAEMGRVLFDGGYLSSAYAVDLLLAAEQTTRVETLLDGITQHALSVAVVGPSSPDGGAEIAIGRSGDHDELTGRASNVLSAGTADAWLVVTTSHGRSALFEVRPGVVGAEYKATPTVDQSRMLYDLSLARVRGDLLAECDCAVIEEATARMIVRLAAEMVGSAHLCLEQTLAYVKERKQFGRLIGSFQALKHRLADLHVSIDVAWEMVRLAADTIDTGDREAARLVASAAKSAASRTFTHVAKETIQLHGGIGFTWELDAHRFLKRAMVSSVMFGGAEAHERFIAAQFGADAVACEHCV